jgi:hypothetical protein
VHGLSGGATNFVGTWVIAGEESGEVGTCTACRNRGNSPPGCG